MFLRTGAGIAVAALTLVLGGALGGIAAAACPNEALRTGLSAQLGQCRAYEMVTPADKHHNDVAFSTGTVQTSTDGEKLAFVASSAFADTEGTGLLVNYIASRGASGWATHSIVPPQAPDEWSMFGGTSINWLSDSLDSWVLTSKNPPLTPEANPTAANLYLRSSGGYELLTIGSPETFLIAHSFFRDISSDGRQVLFYSSDQLTPDAPPSGGAYKWDDGSLELVSVLPNGEAVEGSPGWPIGEGETYADRTLSADGSRTIFSAGGDQLYLRDGSETQHVSASHATSPDPNGPLPARFATASDDGSIVYFRSRERLTDDSTACGACNPAFGDEGFDLYRYDAGTESLTDITVDANAGDQFGASVEGVLGASEDGSRVYFAATGQLGDAPAVSGLKLYAWHDGSIEFIGALNPGDRLNWSIKISEARTSRLTADGEQLLFTSSAALADAETGGHEEVYLYDASSDRLTCVSCRATGPSAGDAAVAGKEFGTLGPYERHLTNNIVEAGKTVYFETSDGLVPQDGNGKVDVYRWHDGAVSLLTTGESRFDSHFGDATENGRDVFVVTRERLVAGDTDDNFDVYDARIGGGWPEPAPAGDTACDGGCGSSASVAPVAVGISSASLVAPGNRVQPRVKPRLRRCRAVAAKRGRPAKRRCVKRRSGKQGKSARKIVTGG